MGQITSNLEAGPGLKHRDEMYNKGDEDSSGSDNVNVNMHMKSINCVKTKIDMLIEDCLNVKGSNSEIEVGNNTSEEKSADSENGKSENSGDNGKVTSDKGDNEDEEKEGSESTATVSTDRKTTSESAQDGANSPSEDSVEKGERVVVEADEEKTTQPKPEKEEKLKISDLIQDMDQAQRHSRAVTTFQTFIDKVLDNSLIHVPVSDKLPTNFLKLCQESVDPNVESSNRERSENGSIEMDIKPKFDKSCTKIKPERKITLKDHIERFLETSLREETILCERPDGKQTEKKNIVSVTTKNGFPDNFNAQGLINNMITQGLQINKLLSPPLPVNNSKNPSKSPDIRVPTDHVKQEYMKEHPKMDLKSEIHISANSKSEAGPVRGYMYQQKTSAPSANVHSGHPLQLSPGQMSMANRGQVNMAAHTRTKQMGKEVRDPHPQGHMTEYKAYEAQRRDYPYSRPYPAADYPGEHVRGGHSVGYPVHMDHAGKVGAGDHAHHTHHPHQVHPTTAGYPLTYSPRMPGATPYHPIVAPQHMEDQRSASARQPHHPLHHKDCICPMCVSHPRHALDQRDAREQKKLEYQLKRRSPNLPPHMMQQDSYQRGHYAEPTPAMVRANHMKYPPATASTTAMVTMPKLLPQQPPMTAAKEYGHQLMVPGHNMGQGRRPSLPENHVPRQYMPVDRRAEYANSEAAEEYSRRLDGYCRGGNLSPYPVRPSSMPSNDHVSSDGAHMMRQSPAISDSGSRSSEASTDGPLDLTVKKVKVTVERPRSSSYSSGGQNYNVAQKKLNPPNTFLRHLENSVDKYCQEVTSPEDNQGTIRNSRPMSNKAMNANDNKQSLMYPAPNSHQSSVHNMYSIPTHRKLPSPQFTGGITMGQPLVDSRSQTAPRNGDYIINSPSPQTVARSTPQLNNSQPSLTTAQANFDANNKRNINTVSKHEPIQNIIGSHDPNDILYLICTVCTQTYGSPYGFRKHFRNQHGFEPCAEHTIVQTISATKSALHGPETKGTVVMSDMNNSLTGTPPTATAAAARAEWKESGASQASVRNTEMERPSGTESPYSRKCPNEEIGDVNDKNGPGGQQTDKSDKVAQDEISERKCLECPECGKTFQLNDFGSYKRHCRQHNNIKVTGPYTCTDCHLSFPDQKALKEHYIFHVTESHNLSTDKSGARDSSSSGKPTASGVCFSCAKCDKQFDNVTVYNNHIVVHDQPPELSPQISLQTKKETLGATSVTSASSSTSVKSSLSVIPSQCIVKEAAESMTAQVCPDSSWDESAKPVVSGTGEEKGDEEGIETSDSGYSSSAGSSYMLNLEDKNTDNSDKGPAVAVARQKSRDSNSENGNENVTDETVFYKHKKFFHLRKRESSCSMSVQSTPPKQAKLAEISSDTGTPVSSSTAPPVDVWCDSSESKEVKTDVDKEKLSSTEISASKMSAETDEKLVKEVVTAGKGEARHNLPFVWDRTTRNHRKINS